MKLKDKILNQRQKEKENKLSVIDEIKEREEIKKTLISRCDEVIKEIKQYITENVNFFEELKSKIIKELTDNDTYIFSLDDYTEETSLEDPLLYSFVSRLSCLENKEPEAIEKIKFNEEYKISLRYVNNLPHGEEFEVFLYDTFDFYNIHFKNILTQCPDSIYASNCLEISFDKEKLADYLKEQGLTVNILNENKIQVSL